MDNAEPAFRTEGNEWIGRRIYRSVREDDGTESTTSGIVTGWLPAEEADFLCSLTGQPAPLWHAVYDSGSLAGDEEDLERHEVRESRRVREITGQRESESQSERDRITTTAHVQIVSTRAVTSREERHLTVTVRSSSSPCQRPNSTTARQRQRRQRRRRRPQLWRLRPSRRTRPTPMAQSSSSAPVAVLSFRSGCMHTPACSEVREKEACTEAREE